MNRIDPHPEQRMMTLPGCPVTGGLPTRMTSRGFYEACAAAQDAITYDQRVIPCCFECKGLPAELEIIKLEDFKVQIRKLKKYGSIYQHRKDKTWLYNRQIGRP